MDMERNVRKINYVTYIFSIEKLGRLRGVAEHKVLCYCDWITSRRDT